MSGTFGLISAGLTEPWGRPDELAAVAISIVMRDDALRTAVARAAAEWPRQLPAQELLSPALLPAFGDPLLHRLLEEHAHMSTSRWSSS